MSVQANVKPESEYEPVAHVPQVHYMFTRDEYLLKLGGQIEKIIDRQNSFVEKEDFRDLKREVKDLRIELKAELGELKEKQDTFATKDELYAVRDELKADIRELRAELKGNMSDLRTELKGDIKNLSDRVDILAANMESMLKHVQILSFTILAVLVAMFFGLWTLFKN